MQFIEFIGVRGRHDTTTVALAAAGTLEAHRTDSRFTGEVAREVAAERLRISVLRGPDYLACAPSASTQTCTWTASWWSSSGAGHSTPVTSNRLPAGPSRPWSTTRR